MHLLLPKKHNKRNPEDRTRTKQILSTPIPKGHHHPPPTRACSARTERESRMKYGYYARKIYGTKLLYKYGAKTTKQQRWRVQYRKITTSLTLPGRHQHRSRERFTLDWVGVIFLATQPGGSERWTVNLKRKTVSNFRGLIHESVSQWQEHTDAGRIIITICLPEEPPLISIHFLHKAKRIWRRYAHIQSVASYRGIKSSLILPSNECKI